MVTTRPPGPSTELRASAPRAAGHDFTPAELAALRPHVVLLEDGALSTEQVDHPRTVGEFTTTAADVEEIFRTHLPEFVEQHRPGPVPIVVYAHGGLVDRGAGFEIALQQVDWWKANGVYPIHLVWQTAFGTALWDALGRWASGRRGWVDEAWDGFLETAARLLGGGAIWNDMKLDAAAASVADGGGAKLAAELGAFMSAPGRSDLVSVSAVGHSAGSIFHSHFVPRALASGVPEFEHVDFLAPAVRIDTFRKMLVPHVESGKVRNLAVFEMDDKHERDDDCKVYRKSLLYLVAASFEPRKDTPILGMEKYLRADPACARLFTAADAVSDLVISPRDNRRPSASGSTSHGGFDDDPLTMESVAMRIAGRSERDVTRFPIGRRERSLAPWDVEVPAPPTVGADASRDATTGLGTTRRIALCIGIDAYPDENDRLAGCVADAKGWAGAFREQGFDVRELTDAAATRDAILMAILDLVAGSSPGDVLAIQYSGHGTFVPDLDGDEDDGDVANDEAICPVDFRGTGRLVIDDDLARIWDVIPEGVSVTAFFDSCHSGSANRAPDVPDAPAGSRARVRRLTEEDKRAYRADRGAAATEDAAPLRADAAAALADSETPPAPGGRPVGPHREVLLSACRAGEVAWETNGHGDFTSRALPLLAASVGSTSNRDFVAAVVEQLGPNRRQTPEFHGDEVLGGRPLLSPATDATSPLPLAPAVGGPTRGVDRRTAAIVSILRATADLLEGEA
ncbi:hypothetical protein GCM10009819_10260 [Agromyces tropicus]|uniref:Peptidase C14 caspase domain-containing protein n=1 Tax=Agromyces tropicus TaxID=555371 RepID=A0ABN2U3H9_9MICO